MRRYWPFGDKKAGMSLDKLKRRVNPWRVQVWAEGKVIRRETFATANDAEEYVKMKLRKIITALRGR